MNSELPHEIIAIIGEPGAGKTTSCLTFPNRYWVDFDHKLPQGEPSAPFWDPAFIDKYARRTQKDLPNGRDAFCQWLKVNGPKFAPEQTVIFDSASKLLNLLDIQCNLEKDLQGGSKDSVFKFWGHKLRFWQETMILVKQMKCRVVWTFHTTVERDAEGNLTGKLKPLLDGSYKDQILGDFTDVWRMLHDPIDVGPDGRAKIVNGRKAINHGWFWQLVGDSLVDTNTNPTLGKIIRNKQIQMVKADYNEITNLYNQ